MPRIRSLKPSFWEDGDVASLTLPARLVLVGLISLADDDGRFVATPTAIGGYLFPHDDFPPAKIRTWLAEIERKAPRTVTFYEVAGRRYGTLRNYRRHQRISHPQPSQLPPPPGEETLL